MRIAKIASCLHAKKPRSIGSGANFLLLASCSAHPAYLIVAVSVTPLKL